MTEQREQESSGSGALDDSRTQPLSTSGSAPDPSTAEPATGRRTAQAEPDRSTAEPAPDRPAPRSGADRRAAPSADRRGADDMMTDSGSTSARAVPPRSGVPRGGPERVSRTAATAGRQRRARLRLARIDPWSVLLLSLLVSLFLAVVVVVAVVALYAVLEAAGVPDSVNALVAEVTRTPGEAEPEPLLSAGRALWAAGVIAVVDVVLLTALATLSAVLYNLCASFTGGLEVTLAEDS